MLALETYQARPLTGAASTIVLSTKGGAILGGIWVSSKTATGILQAWDTASATPTLNKFIASVLSLPKGLKRLGPVETGTGLVIKTASIKGCIFWRPSQAGGA